MEPKTPFGAALRYYRKGIKNLTQPKLSKALGVSQAMLSKIELGKADGSAELRETIAEYFKVTYSEFLETGRRKLAPVKPDTDLLNQLAERVENLEQKQPLDQPASFSDYLEAKNREHHKKINEFINQEKALNMNSLAVYLEKIEPSEIDKAIEYLKERISVQEALKGIKQPIQHQGNGTLGE